MMFLGWWIKYDAKHAKKKETRESWRYPDSNRGYLGYREFHNEAS